MVPVALCYFQEWREARFEFEDGDNRPCRADIVQQMGWSLPVSGFSKCNVDTAIFEGLIRRVLEPCFEMRGVSLCRPYLVSSMIFC
ncbi:hypothetical protein JCGZ_19779 [Jatropha curcas]|uniref:Uncharacterized protein n=1 Tax=Jatropha curcas TaxID=180498 RepID=A0A067K677_JATCU|nr:hypothetical protein JCGZ_19779 [Jatropha curcas]